MKDTVLVTGGLGYVGGRVAQALAGSQRYFLRLGTRQTGITAPSWLCRGDIVRVDIMSEDDLTRACSEVKYIVHLAALNEIDSVNDPEQALLVNGLGTLKLLRAALKAGVERFIYFSTAHVYGSPLTGTITEEKSARPVHPYAVTHRVAEDFVLAAHDQGKIIGLVLRLSNGFGAPINADINRWTLVANDLCRQAVTSGKLVLKSPGLQWRDFITMQDVGRAVIHFLELPSSQCGNGLFNLGGELPLRIIDIAEMIADRSLNLLGCRPPIMRPEPIAGEKHETVCYKIDKLKNTGFSLQGNTFKEIDATILLCREAFGGGS